MNEWGVFNDEGLIEGQLYSREEAEARLSEEYADDEWAEACEICPDHEGERRDCCEECFAEEDES